MQARAESRLAFLQRNLQAGNTLVLHFLPAGRIPEAESKAVRSRILVEKDAFSPCALNEHKGEFSLLFVRFDNDFMDRAEKHKGMGGGYTMEAMVESALQIEGLELPDLEPASEGSMFAMRGEKSSLKIVADIVRKLLAEPDYAEATIAHSVAQGLFE
jgi:hypothetical protein